LEFPPRSITIVQEQTGDSAVSAARQPLAAGWKTSAQSLPPAMLTGFGNDQDWADLSDRLHAAPA